MQKGRKGEGALSRPVRPGWTASHAAAHGQKPALMGKGLSRHSHFDLLWMQSSKEGFGLAKKRGLNDIPGGDALNPEQISKL